MSNEPSSLVKAFREHAGEGGAVLGVDVDPMQLDLLRDDSGRLPSDVFRRARAGDAGKRGRPPGARNKRSVKTAKLITAQHGDPVMFMASVYAMPLDQLVELLERSDGSGEREDRLLAMVEDVTQTLASMRTLNAFGVVDPKKLVALFDTLSNVADAAASLKSKRGELAIKALAAQIVAAKEVGPYVHGKQPLSVEIKGKADMVLLIPGLNAPSDVDPRELQNAVEAHGLEAIDFEHMRMIDHAPIADDDEEEG